MTLDADPADWLGALSAMTRERIPREALRPATPDRAPCTATELGLPETMGGEDLRVSVIIPTHTDTAYLPDALQSVGAQTVTDLEVVLIDSSQESWVADLAAERSWIRHFATEPAGVSTARNDGIAHAQGEYIAFLDVDDYWHPEKLHRQLDAMGETHQTAYTGYVLLNHWEPGTPSASVMDVDEQDPYTADMALISRRIDAHISTLVCSADIVPNRPFDESREHFEDVSFVIEQFRAHPPAHVAEPLTVRRLRPGSLAHNTDPIQKAHARISVFEQLARSYPDYTVPVQESIAQETYRMGITHLRRGEIAPARAKLWECIQSHPRPVKAGLLYVATYLPVNLPPLLDRIANRTATPMMNEASD